MKETNFIKQNQAKWSEFEAELANKNKNPEKLSRLFIETTDDLSFSRTYYPSRSVRVYLNNVAQKTYQLIYKNKKSKEHTFGTFWKDQLPDTMWHNRKQLLWAFVIFILGLGIAVFSSIHNPEFATIMLGEGYIEMTIENIQKGDPMGVYGSMDPLEMFLNIAGNNIRVCFIVFLAGLFFGAGSIVMLFKESVRFGAFMFFFYQRGLFEDAFYAVMLHGTIELSMIILSGMAGMVLAKGMVFPKTYSRLQSFVSTARQGVMIMIGISVFLVMAAFIEGYATRHTELSNLIRGGIIFLSFAIVFGYFVVYPFVRWKKGNVDSKRFEDLMNEREIEISLSSIKENGTIFTEIFYFFKNHIYQHLRFALLIGIGVTGFIYLETKEDMGSFIFDSGNSYGNNVNQIVSVLNPWNEVNNFFDFNNNILLTIPYVFFTGIILLSSVFYFKQDFNPNLKLNNITIRQVISVLISSVLIICPFVFEDWNVAFVLVSFPFLVLVTVTSILDDLTWGKAVQRTFQLLGGNWVKFIGIFWYSIAIPWMVLIASSSQIWRFIYMILESNFEADSVLASLLPNLIYSFFTIFLLSLVFPIMIYGLSLFRASIIEINEAVELKKEIQNIGFKKHAYGLEKE